MLDSDICDAIKHSPTIIMITNADSEIEYVNNKFEEITGYISSEVVGKTPRFLTHPDYKKPTEFYKELWDTITSGTEWKGTFCNRKKNGEPYWERAVISSIKDDDGNITKYIANKEDFTERKELIDALEQSEKRYHELFDNISSGVAIGAWNDKTSKFVLVDFNKSAEIIEHVKKEDVIGKNVLDVFKFNDSVTERAMKVMETGEPEFIPKTQLGDQWRKIFFYKLFTGELVAVFEDITERIITEEILKKAKEKAEESDRLKTAFLANMSHEIRTPMNAIVGFSDLLANMPDAFTDDERKKYIRHITNSSDQLLRLIDDIIDIAKIEAQQLKIVHEKCFINQMLDELKDEAESKLVFDNVEIKVVKNIPYEDFSIISDDFRIKQILNNLLANAIKFTEEGEIIIGYEITKEREIKFFVKDTGTGIPEDQLEIIWDRFRQVETVQTDKLYGGTGLGLTISKSLAKLLGGRMWADSQVGVGSKFYFVIPLNGVSTTQQRKKIQKINNGHYNWGNKGILIAEDDLVNLTYMSEVLKTTKIKIYTAVNGEEALEVYVANKDKIDVVLVDIKMPIMDGYDVLKQIRKLDSDVCIIIQTAHVISGEKEKLLKVGASDYLNKPIRAITLLKTIKKFLK